MIKKFNQFESINIKDKIEKLKKAIEDNKSKSVIKKSPSHIDANYKPTNDDFDGIISDIRLNFDPSYINDYIVYNFDKFCNVKEMEEAGYTDEVKYYKEFVDSEDIEDAITEEIWEYVVDKYGIDFDLAEYEDLKFLIDYYIQENFPFYSVSDFRS